MCYIGKFDPLLELVDSPFRHEADKVHRIFSILSGPKSDDKKFLMNKVLLSWMVTLKLKKPMKNGRDYYSASSQNQKLRAFFGAVKSRFNWEYDRKDFKGFGGALLPVMDYMYSCRRKEDVSVCCYWIIQL